MRSAAASSTSSRPGEDEPVRLDFFGDTLETIRGFDPETQRSTTPRKRIDLVPASEMLLTPESIARFRERYVALFGAADRDDLLYQSVSEGRRYVGMEHWLPLFADGLETLFDHVGDAPVVLDHLADEAVGRAARPDRRPLRGARPGAGRGRAGRLGPLQAAPPRERST